MHSVPGWSRPSIIARYALLPAYLGLYLGTGDTRVGWRAIPRALAMSAMVTLSFVLLFGAVGLLLSAATSALVSPGLGWLSGCCWYSWQAACSPGVPSTAASATSSQTGWEGLPAAEGPGATPP